MNPSTPQTILNKIKVENIKPTARWYFVMKHAVLWVPGVLVTLIGAVAVAGELYAITHSGWELKDFIYSSQTDFMLTLVPYVWMVSFVLFGSLIVAALRTTHEGYRFSMKTILIGSVTSSFVLGVCIYALDEIFEADSLIRYPVHLREQQVWFSPSEGRLSGTIEKKSESDIKILDKDNTTWTIDMSGFGSTTPPFVEEGKSIRVIGTSTGEEDIDDHVFIACAVFPWEIGGFTRASPSSSTVSRPRGTRVRNSVQNKNPDCKAVLDNIKQQIREGHNQKVKENK